MNKMLETLDSVQYNTTTKKYSLKTESKTIKNWSSRKKHSAFYKRQYLSQNNFVA